MSDALVFTNAWFGPRILAVWERLFRDRPPARILEVGCFEGASTCALIRHFARSRPLELHCVDTWDGGLEHQPGGPCEADMREVEARSAKPGGFFESDLVDPRYFSAANIKNRLESYFQMLGQKRAGGAA